MRGAYGAATAIARGPRETRSHRPAAGPTAHASDLARPLRSASEPTPAGEPTRLALGASTLTIHERERPLASVDVLVTRCLAQLHAEGLRDAAPTDRVLVTTREGEYGALVTIAAPGEPAKSPTRSA